MTVTLTQVQWLSVRRAEGNGFYTWDTERKEIPAGSWTVTTATDPVPLEIPIPNGGYFLLVDRALNIRGTYDSGHVRNLDQLMSDARYLARTQR